MEMAQFSLDFACSEATQMLPIVNYLLGLFSSSLCALHTYMYSLFVCVCVGLCECVCVQCVEVF